VGVGETVVLHKRLRSNTPTGVGVEIEIEVATGVAIETETEVATGAEETPIIVKLRVCRELRSDLFSIKVKYLVVI
jgi:hypothetical protein